VAKAEREEADVCRGLSQQRAVDIYGVFVAVCDST